MSNRKLNKTAALTLLNKYFMQGGSSKNLCKLDTIDNECNIAKLRPEWCEMTTDMSCVYSSEGKQNIDNHVDNISKRIKYIPQGMSELKNILDNTEIYNLIALCKLLNIETTSETKAVLVDKILKNRINVIITGRPIWSYI